MRALLLAVTFLTVNAAADQPMQSVGVANSGLTEGALALLRGRHEKGIELTLRGLEEANNKMEEEVALSNLCAGYTNMGEYAKALRYCDILLTRNDKAWRGYNSKALIYIFTKQYDKAEDALIKGEALNSGAHTMKIARGLYLDATQPVVPEIVIDDRDKEEQL